MSELVPNDIGSVVGRQPGGVVVQDPSGKQFVTSEEALTRGQDALTAAKRKEESEKAGLSVSPDPGHQPFNPRKRKGT